MSLRLYLDECIDSGLLVRELQAAGHLVQRPRDAGLTGKPDPQHFAHVRQHDHILITSNPPDFWRLHSLDPRHAGIFAVYQDNDPRRDMTAADIVRAIQNILDADVPIAGHFLVLNHWRY